MTTLTVALLQLAAAGNDQAANAAKGEAACRRAAAVGADIALFPELWNIGYTPYPGCPRDFCQVGAESPEQLAARAVWQAQAVPRDGEWVGRFRNLARELGIAIAITYLEPWPGAPRNTVTLFDRHGAEALTYAKVHTCDFSLEAACTPGDAFPVAELETATGPVRVGAMICYDREFPESARLLMLNGAEIILVPNACELETNRLTQLRTRAYENMVGVATANYAAPTQNGHSVAYDGVAFWNRRSRETLVVEAGEAEGLYLARFDLDQLRTYRAREIWGNAFRRPHAYAGLLDSAVAPPFVRSDATGRTYDPTRR